MTAFKHIKRCLAPVLAIWMAWSCTSYVLDDPDTVVTIPNEWSGYIHFGSESVSSKASNLVTSNLVTSMSGLDYHVIAFQYPSTTNWSTFMATGTPSMNDPKFKFPTSVEYNNETGTWTYDARTSNGGQNGTDQLVAWVNGKRYTFFAYYPQSSPDSPVTLNTDPRSAGTPVITYTTPSGLNPLDPSALKDVVTAAVKDATSSVGTVNFAFKHRLSCLTIEARNFDQIKDTDNESQINAKKQTIQNLTLHISSKMYTTLDIPLDPLMASTPGGERYNVEYTISGSTPINVDPIPVGGEVGVVSVSGGNNILFIPQSPNGPDGNPDTDDNMPHLQGYVTFTDKGNLIQTGDISMNGVDGYKYDTNLQFTSDKDFVAGKKYSVIINFTNGNISVAIIESGDWEDENVTHTFE